ncbi:uncharacterized protein KY384_001314 [Bacidia gigantensis]|uniref:uncharacterized protein n=1 Tax=Bacidia gigantensis TaxID=2732470 RepID=UPI001D05A8E6|nr:uncharacterized protein KY384_001314 [Bacidia gigantensis]KAG8533574.1 hypothetical protein KY384_001314 [Bacidia gigantensis]
MEPTDTASISSPTTGSIAEGTNTTLPEMAAASSDTQAQDEVALLKAALEAAMNQIVVLEARLELSESAAPLSSTEESTNDPNENSMNRSTQIQEPDLHPSRSSETVIVKITAPVSATRESDLKLSPTTQSSQKPPKDSCLPQKPTLQSLPQETLVNILDRLSFSDYLQLLYTSKIMRHAALDESTSRNRRKVMFRSLSVSQNTGRANLRLMSFILHEPELAPSIREIKVRDKKKAKSGFSLRDKVTCSKILDVHANGTLFKSNFEEDDWTHLTDLLEAIPTFERSDALSWTEYFANKQSIIDHSYEFKWLVLCLLPGLQKLYFHISDAESFQKFCCKVVEPKMSEHLIQQHPLGIEYPIKKASLPLGMLSQLTVRATEVQHEMESLLDLLNFAKLPCLSEIRVRKKLPVGSDLDAILHQWQLHSTSLWNLTVLSPFQQYIRNVASWAKDQQRILGCFQLEKNFNTALGTNKDQLFRTYKELKSRLKLMPWNEEPSGDDANLSPQDDGTRLHFDCIDRIHVQGNFKTAYVYLQFKPLCRRQGLDIPTRNCTILVGYMPDKEGDGPPRVEITLRFACLA